MDEKKFKVGQKIYYFHNTSYGVLASEVREGVISSIDDHNGVVCYTVSIEGQKPSLFTEDGMYEDKKQALLTEYIRLGDLISLIQKEREKVKKELESDDGRGS